MIQHITHNDNLTNYQETEDKNPYSEKEEN
jgi:hypothetical protein